MTPSHVRENNCQENEDPSGVQCPRLVTRELHDLRPHPSYTKHRLSVLNSRLAALAEFGDLAFVQPILVSRKGIIVDGYARWELARRQGRATILCLEYDWSDEEALRWLIQSHSPSKGFNGFSRCLLALDLEPSLQERARVNQQIGGQGKSSSHLTEAQKLDVRSEIAAVASVSTRSLTKETSRSGCTPHYPKCNKIRRDPRPQGLSVEPPAPSSPTEEVGRISELQGCGACEPKTHSEACSKNGAGETDSTHTGPRSQVVDSRSHRCLGRDLGLRD